MNDLNGALVALVAVAIAMAAAVWHCPLAAKDISRTLARRAFALQRSRLEYKAAYEGWSKSAEGE